LVRTVWTAVLLAYFHSFCFAQSQTSFVSPAATDTGATTAPPANCRILYLGFVGALEPAGNTHSGVVQIRKTLQGKDYSDVCANSFSPYVWTDGRDWLLKHFPSHAGPLSPAELEQAPKVILVGHSMGGWAMMSVARELRSRDIPVELTIQVDSVGITDYTIPRNVKCAAIFHANDVLMFMTTKHVRLEDPDHTKMLEDVKVDGANHQSITRDPRIRELVMKTVQDLRSASASNAAAGVAPPAAKSVNPANKE
jgi:pimeloyl-ACP methyl ester carboxylesterase